MDLENKNDSLEKNIKEYKILIKNKDL